jgi:CheY-like chemotaxis protein
VTWNTIQDHQGGIALKSGDGGTTFALYFPATRGRLPSMTESVDIAPYLGHGEKVLVVDDDTGQLTIASQILDRLNYTGAAANSGEDALQYLRQNTVDLVILDMVMAPGMNGCETYRKILDLYPRQLAIITSGYSESDDVRAAKALGVRRFVKKPYRIGTLAAAIHDTLSNR